MGLGGSSCRETGQPHLSQVSKVDSTAVSHADGMCPEEMG